jgi:hypothetical protein
LRARVLERHDRCERLDLPRQFARLSSQILNVLARALAFPRHVRVQQPVSVAEIAHTLRPATRYPDGASLAAQRIAAVALPVRVADGAHTR